MLNIIMLFFLYAAQSDLDFIAPNKTIIFSVGANKGNVQCVQIEIVKDLLDESQETFVLEANIISPTSANFGRALHSSSGRISVIINGKLC